MLHTAYNNYLHFYRERYISIDNRKFCRLRYLRSTRKIYYSFMYDTI